MHTKKISGKMFLIFSVVVLISVIGVYSFLRPKKSVANNTVPDSRVELEEAKSSLTLNRQFDFPLRDAKGKEITKIKYVIENAEKRDEIIVKGQKATSLKGKTFLILSIKISNSYDKSIEINSRDYIRLSVNGTGEMAAADIHNDPVIVQPISTKNTRIGFPIDDTATNLVLSVGEIKGTKDTVNLTF